MDQKIQAVVDYGERLKTRSENDILYRNLTNYIGIQTRNIIIIAIILYYFRSLILEKNNLKEPNTKPNKEPIREERIVQYRSSFNPRLLSPY